MAYGNEIPIRESILVRFYQLIDKHKGNLTVVEYDVQMQTWMQPPQAIGQPPTMINCWCLVVLCLGALLGPDNYLSYVWTLGHTPQVPSDTLLEESCREMFQRIGIMKMQQLQRGPAAGNAN
jgi:hypothetical protein